jgi:hypothetical protein
MFAVRVPDDAAGREGSAAVDVQEKRSSHRSEGRAERVATAPPHPRGVTTRGHNGQATSRPPPYPAWAESL